VENRLHEVEGPLKLAGERPVNFMKKELPDGTLKDTTVTEAQQMVEEAMDMTGHTIVRFAKKPTGERLIVFDRPQTEVVFNLHRLKGDSEFSVVAGARSRVAAHPGDKDTPWYYKDSGGVRPSVTDFELEEAALKGKLPHVRMMKGDELDQPEFNPFAFETSKRAFDSLHSLWSGFLGP
jgi:hypothetical protein